MASGLMDCGQGGFVQPDGGHRPSSFFSQLQQVSRHQLRWRRQGRHSAGLGPLLEGAPGGGITDSGVGVNAPVQGVLDAAAVLVGEAGGVVAIDRIGRRWMDTVNTVRDLRARKVKIRSLAQSEATWVTYLDAEPDTPEAVIGDILTTFMAWAAEQEMQAVSRRTRAGLQKARAEGKTLGPPRIIDDDQVEAMARLRREGQSLRSIGRLFGVSRTTVQRRLQEAVNLEDEQTS